MAPPSWGTLQPPPPPPRAGRVGVAVALPLQGGREEGEEGSKQGRNHNPSSRFVLRCVKETWQILLQCWGAKWQRSRQGETPALLLTWMYKIIFQMKLEGLNVDNQALGLCSSSCSVPYFYKVRITFPSVKKNLLNQSPFSLSGCQILFS